MTAQCPMKVPTQHLCHKVPFGGANLHTRKSAVSVLPSDNQHVRFLVHGASINGQPRGGRSGVVRRTGISYCFKHITSTASCGEQTYGRDLLPSPKVVFASQWKVCCTWNGSES